MFLKCSFKIGDQVHAWGIGFDEAYTTPGSVTRLYQEQGQWYVDWHNELARHYAVRVESLVPAGRPMSFGLERVVPVRDKETTK